MANILDRNPMVITAAMTSSYKAAVATELGTLSTLIVERLYWENAVTVGDFVRIIDPQSGESLAEMRNGVVNSSPTIDWTAHPRLWADFRVSQIDSGTLYVFTR